MIPDHIIIHHSLTADGETVSWGAIRKYHKSLGWSDIGYHFGIETIGDHDEILIGRMSDANGAHCKQQMMNTRSIGICVVGNFDLAAPSEEKMSLLIRLVKYLQGIYKIPVESVKRHNEFASYKSCPGLLFPWNNFKDRL